MAVIKEETSEDMVQLEVEGIQNMSDLQDFDKNALNQVASNLRCPVGGAAAFVFGAKSQKNPGVFPHEGSRSNSSRSSRILPGNEKLDTSEHKGNIILKLNFHWMP